MTGFYMKSNTGVKWVKREIVGIQENEQLQKLK